MKKISFLLLMVIPVFTGYSQKSKGYNAQSYYKNYLSTKDPDLLQKAKENIDLASEHADTKDNSSIQINKGQIYLAIYEAKIKTLEESLTNIADPTTRTFAVLASTPTTDLEIAYQAFLKGKSLDKKDNYTEELQALNNIAVYYDNTGRANLNVNKYPEALADFEHTYQIHGDSDTTILYYCGISAELAKEYGKAKDYYQKMIDTKHPREKTYPSLVNIYFILKDTVGGMALLKQGRAAYPNDINLVIMETNYFIKIHKTKEALNNLNTAIQVKPTDANLYIVRGNMYDNLANPKDATGKELDKPSDYDENIKMAEADYKKAIELTPDSFDALFNLGVLYNNEGVLLNNQADKILDNAQYAAANAKATEQFNKAMPILEKALEIDPKDRSTMIALKQIYMRMQLTDKLKAINERLKN